MTSSWNSLTAKAAVIFAALAVLSACGSARETFGLNKSAPDEFNVVTRAPLVLPPNFRERPSAKLKKPTPGILRPQEVNSGGTARRLLIDSARRPAGASGQDGSSAGESALLRRAGAENADPNIRTTVDKEAALASEDANGLLGFLLFWQEKETPGRVVDAPKEAKRIQENVALGEKVTKGRVPVIKRRERGWLEGIF